MTKTEYLEQICKALGIDTSKLPDRLLSTYLSAIAVNQGVDLARLTGEPLSAWLEAIAQNAGGGGGGGGIQLDDISKVDHSETMFQLLYQVLDSSYETIVKYVGNEFGTFSGDTLTTTMGMDLYTSIEALQPNGLYMHTLTLDENGNYHSKFKYIGKA